MTFGKTERMVAVVIGIVALAATIHFLIFQKKAETYNQTSQEYTAAVEQLSTAEFIRNQQAFEEYKQRTSQYSDLVTSVVDELNLVKLDLPTSPPVGAVDRWASGTIELLTKLTAAPPANLQLPFLGKDGWDLSAQLPAVGGAGALADRVSQLNGTYQELQVAKGNVQAEWQVLKNYNARLTALGVNPQQVSNFYYPAGGGLFFNNEEWIKAVLSQSGASRMATSNDLQPYYNIYGLQRFGQAIPVLKKIWLYALVSRAMQAQNPETVRVDPNILPRFGEALQIGVPLEDEPLNSINKQLTALLDIIAIAGQTGIQEIQQVRFMRPINVGKATLRVPGALPPVTTPAPTPANAMGGMGMGMMEMGLMGGMGGPNAQPMVTPIPDAERVGTGAGIELVLKADNASLTRFYYQLSHVTRTYGIDDLYVYSSPQGVFTTATVEVITDINTQGTAGAAPAEGAI